MARVARRSNFELLVESARARWAGPGLARFRGGVVAACGLALVVAFASYHATDPSLNASGAGAPRNLLGGLGADVADIALQSLGLGAWGAALIMVMSGLGRAADPDPALGRSRLRRRSLIGAVGVLAITGLLAAPPAPESWPLARGLGGFWGEGLLGGMIAVLAFARLPGAGLVAAGLLAMASAVTMGYAAGMRWGDLAAIGPWFAARLARGAEIRRAGAGNTAARSSPPGRDALARRGGGGCRHRPVQRRRGPGPGRTAQGQDAARAGAGFGPRTAGESEGLRFRKPGGFHLPELAMLG